MASNFSKNLKRIRLEKGLTQSELGQLVNVHSNHISRYEREDSSPTAEILIAFANALDVSVDELLIGSRSTKIKEDIEDVELLKLVRDLEQLDKEEKATVKDLISAFIFRNETRKKLA